MASKAARGLLVVFAIAAAVGWWWIHRSIPPLNGRLQLAGLRAPVDVRFDSFAIPHVFAISDEDGWRTVGYLQARDRAWQMELYRRAASGRLSELLGEATIAIDRRFLTLGLRRAAEMEWQRTPPRVRTAFENYAAGVNVALLRAGAQRPLEHQLLGLAPEPWTPIDSLSIGKLFAWRLGDNHTAELLRYAMLQELGPKALELFPEMPEWAPTILESGASEGKRQRAEGRRQRAGGKGQRAYGEGEILSQGTVVKSHLTDPSYPRGLEWLSADARAMSNSWVVHGSRTASGRPILANDPHLAIEMPSVWWEMHLVSRELDVAGVTIPGIPFVVIGHNAKVAWGLTNVGADVQDFFVEQLDEARRRYRVGEQWVPLTVRQEVIRVKGRAEPVRFEVASTRHGPLLNADQWREVRPGDPGESQALEERPLAFKWTAIVEGISAAAFDDMARATGWTEFVAAVRRFSAPAQNFVYADVDGNIGYAMSGLLPGRVALDGSVPTPGSSADAGWAGDIDPANLPAVLNPPSGLIITANNEIDRQLSFVVTKDWVAPFRAQRIAALIADRRGLDVDAMTKIQSDVTSLSAGWLLDHVEIPDAIAELRTWDRRVDERPTSLLYHAFEEALWERTFGDEMSPALYDRFYRFAGSQRFAGLLPVLERADSVWFDDRRTPRVVEGRADIARHAARDALSGLQTRFGDRQNWKWNEIHSVKFSHALSGGARILDWVFSRGPIPIAGDTSTVNKTTINMRRRYETSEAASYRQILDVGAWDRSLAVNTTGQSGHPRSPHYFDQNELWRQGRYRALPFTRRAVESAAASRLELVP